MVLALAGCVGGNNPDEVAPTTVLPAVDTTAVVADPAPDGTVENTMRDASEEAEVEPIGGATVTVGDRTWTFDDGVACLFDEDAAGVGAEFAMSAVSATAELYVAIGPDGHVATIVDLADPANPTSFTTTGSGRFIRIDGAAVTARATFVPVPVEPPAGSTGTATSSAPASAGTVDARCD